MESKIIENKEGLITEIKIIDKDKKEVKLLIDQVKYGILDQKKEDRGGYGLVIYTKNLALKIVEISLNFDESMLKNQDVLKYEKIDGKQKNRSFSYNERELKFYSFMFENKIKCDYLSQIEYNIELQVVNDRKFGIIPLKRYDMSLLEFLDQTPDVSLKQLLIFSKNICEGIQFLHKNKLMHRDVKEGNIFVQKKENGELIAVLGDFTTIRVVENSSQLKTGNVGTPSYQAPEIKSNQKGTNMQLKYDDSVDIYSLGVVLFRMFSGLKISQQKIQQKIQERKRDEENADINKIYQIIQSCLEQYQEQRPKVEELIEQMVLMLLSQEEENAERLSIEREQDLERRLMEKMKREYLFKSFTRMENEKELKVLEDEQQTFIRSALNRNFCYLNKYLDGEVIPESLEIFFQKIFQEFILGMSHPQNMSESDCLEISERLRDLYVFVHEEFDQNFSYGEKLFCEFFIGFSVVYRLTAVSCTKLFLDSNILDAAAKRNIQEDLSNIEKNLSWLEERPSDEKYWVSEESSTKSRRELFWDSQYSCLRIMQKIQRELFLGEDYALKKEQMEEKWNLIQTLVLQKYELNGTFQNLCSLRYIPQEPIFLCLAQILHWRGFGGQGEVLPSEQDPYIQELVRFRDMSIRYVKKESTHFEGQHILKNMFIPILTDVSTQFNKFLEFAAQKFFAEQNPKNTNKMCLLDFGSGPAIPAVQTLVSKYGKKPNSETQLYVVGTDVDGYSLSQMAQDPNVNKVIYLDLNYIDETHSLLTKPQFHLITSRLVIHQCIDLTNGKTLIPNLLNYVSASLHEKGFFAWLDTGAQCYLQAPIIPGNLVDREGCVPANIYRYLQPNKLGVKYQEGYKALVYIPNILTQSPQAFNLFGGLYMFRAFINLFFKPEEYNQFINSILKLQKDSREDLFNKYILELLLQKCPNIVQELEKFLKII